MANWCNFDVFLVGSNEDIEKFNNLMSTDYSYNLSKDFLKKLGLFDKELSNVREDCEDAYVDLKTARRKAKEAKDEKAIEMLKNISTNTKKAVTHKPTGFERHVLSIFTKILLLRLKIIMLIKTKI